ncbi:MAG: flagellin FliC [Vampirovibrio sp.]
MGLQINTNVQSINAQRLLGQNGMNLSKSFERLASGFKINRASDDAAGFQISEGLRSQIRGNQRAADNVQDAINVVNMADGVMSTVVDNLQRMRELAIQGGSDTLGTDQRSAISKEMVQLTRDIERIANATSFNGKNLFSSITNMKVQVGAGIVSANNTIDIGGTNSGLGRLNASSLGIATGVGAAVATKVSVSTNASALQSISKLDTALKAIGNRRASLGALSNRLQGAGTNLAISIENASATESRIRNTDVAKESAELSKNQILQQASATILAQANQGKQIALNLLR